MTDVIVGPVTGIIGGDTFRIAVTYYRDSNVREYNDSETIRIAGLHTGHMSEEQSLRAMKALEQKLAGRSVKCIVQERDEFGRIVAKIQVL